MYMTLSFASVSFEIVTVSELQQLVVKHEASLLFNSSVLC